MEEEEEEDDPLLGPRFVSLSPRNYSTLPSQTTPPRAIYANSVNYSSQIVVCLDCLEP